MVYSLVGRFNEVTTTTGVYIEVLKWLIPVANNDMVVNQLLTLLRLCMSSMINIVICYLVICIDTNVQLFNYVYITHLKLYILYI